MAVTVVVGGQWGSEGKGAATARLARERSYDWSVRVGGPNAGHSVVDATGRKFALRQLPVAAVAAPDSGLIIAAGSEVDRGVLEAEIAEVEGAGYPVRDRLIVDAEATVLEPRHASQEGGIRTGTTGKGIGGARVERALRDSRLQRMGDVTNEARDTQELLRHAVRRGQRVLIEGTQGYGLGSHAGCFPYCTSGDCRAIDFLAAAGLPPMRTETWVVLRTHPIRIAGTSGPLQEETSWEELGLEPEITTVTKKVRRVGEWDRELAMRSIEANYGGEGVNVYVALMFGDYWEPGLAGADGPVEAEYLERATSEGSRLVGCIEDLEACTAARVKMIGTGPATQLLLPEWNYEYERGLHA